MAGTVADGRTVRLHTPPACWGPIIPPAFKGGNEVTEVDYDRAETLFGMSKGEIRTQVPFTEGVEVGRLPSVTQLSLLVRMDMLAEQRPDSLLHDQYGPNRSSVLLSLRMGSTFELTG